MRALLFLLFLALSACSPDSSPPTPEVTASSGDENYAPEQVPGGVAITSIGDLLGEYRVAGINDAPLNMEQGIAVSIDGPLLSFEPICAGFVWEIQFEGESLKLSRYSEPAPQAQSGMPPIPARPVCAIGVLPEWTELAQAFDAATRVERTSQNAIRFSGGGKSATLFSQ